MKIRYAFFVFINITLIYGCTKHFTISHKQTSQTHIKADSLHLYDSATHYLIAPYKQQLDAKMNIVVGKTQTTLVKEKPEGTLCNYITNASMWYASQKYPSPIDVCVMNYGGIRIPSIEAGNITVGKVFELMPFENELEVLEISGQTLSDLLQLVAASGGWPIDGVKMSIKDNKIVSVLVQNKPLQLDKTYTLLTSDYIANGGDNASMLKQYLKRTSLHYKVRDAILTYTQAKETLNIIKDGRITIEP